MTEAELAEYARVTDADLEEAAALFERLVPGPLGRLLRARPYMPRESIPDVE
jgi:hypothetical protein